MPIIFLATGSKKTKERKTREAQAAIKVENLEVELLDSYMAQAELYEATLALREENLYVMMAMAELYEAMLGGGA